MKKIFLLLVFFTTVHCGMAQFSTMPLNYPYSTGLFSANVVSIVDANHLWVGTQKQQYPNLNYLRYSVAVKTSNGGNTWHFDSIPVPGNPLIVDVAAWDVNTCYYLFADINTGGGSLWKTTDGGSTWTKKTTNQFNGSFADFLHLFSQNNLLVLGDPVNGYFDIQLSQDGGDTWSRVPQANIPAPLAVESGIGGKESSCVIGNTIWFASSGGRCFKSSDGGNNWTAVLIEPNTVHQMWSVCFTDLLHGIFYKRSAVPAVYYQTSDGGATWTPLSLFPEQYDPGISRIDGIYGGYVLCVSDTIEWWNTSVYYTNDSFNTLNKIDSGIFSSNHIYFKDASTGWLSGNFHRDTAIYKYNGLLTSVKTKPHLSENLTIIPNPSSQNSLMTFPSAFLGRKKSLRISDQSGKLIKEYRLNPYDHSMNLNSSSYPNGVYTVELISESGFSANNRWIIYH